MKLKKTTLINYIYLTLEYALIGMTALDWSTHDSEKKIEKVQLCAARIVTIFRYLRQYSSKQLHSETG